MGKPKHRRGTISEETLVDIARNVWAGSVPLYDTLRVPLDEYVIVAGVNPFRVTSIRDNHQQVHVLSEAQDKE